MKKILLSFLFFIFVCIYANAANEAISGWGNTNTSYSTRTNSDGWTATNTALVNVDNTVCPTLNGKTSAIGVLTSPELSGGISSLTLKATNTYKDTKGISLKAEIKQNGAVLASHDFTDASIAQNSIFSQTWDGFNINGEFVIVITNNCPSNKNSNADRVSIISLTWEEGAPVNPNAPESVEISSVIEGSCAQITLSCPTEGAKIFYGFSEDSMDKEYTTPFTVTENCTVYAYAEKDGEKSNVSSYYIDLPYTSFKNVINNSKLTDAVSIVGDFQVIYQNKDKNRLVLTDGESNLLIFKDGSNYSIDYPVGTKISKIEGSVVEFHKCFRLIDAVLTEGGNGASITSIELSSFEGLNYDDNIFDEVVLRNATIAGKDLGKPVIMLGEESITLYDLFEIGYENTVGCEITGFVWKYDDNLVIVPISIEGGVVVSTVETPVITPAQRELKPGDKVTITCATENVKIYYTLDDSDPTEESSLYEEPFDFTGDQVTVKARAYYAGNDENVSMLPSTIASRTYHVWDPTCNVLSEGNHDVNEKNTLGTYVMHSCVVDDVEYHMNAAHYGENGNGKESYTNSSIAMNNNGRFSYLIQVGENEGYVLDRIEVAYNQSDSKIQFAVRGSNIPFDDSAEGYTGDENDNKEKSKFCMPIIQGNGDQIGIITVNNPSIEFDKDYKYFALYPTASGAVYIDNITIYYREPAPLTNPAIFGLEDLDEDNIMYDEDEERYFVMSDHALDIDFDVDPYSDVQVMYVLTPMDQDLTEEPQPQVYDGSSIAIEGATALVYWAVNEKTEEQTEPVSYVFMISSPLEAPAMLGLDDASVEGAETGFLVEADHALNITFDIDPEAFNVQVVYTMSTDEDEDDAEPQVYAGEPIVIDKDCEFSYYAIDMSTGNRSEEVNYMFFITLPEPVAPELPTLKAEGAQIEDGFINCKDNLTINFEVPEGIHVYYSLGTGVDAPKKAHGDADEHKDFTKHTGEAIELTGAHKTLSFYACDPATGLHSDTTTYTLNIATGIADIDADDPDAIYFNLQGVQIAKPENGLYIRVQKGKSEKMMK